MQVPLVSILIPVYNRKPFIGECVESALAQTFRAFEVVIVDNCSTDGTWELLQDYARGDARIRLLRNDCNIGAIPNWVRCFAEARGRYGKILFSDDWMDPEFLAKTLSLMNDDVAFVLTAAEVGSAPGQGLVQYRWKPASGVYSAGEYFAATLGRAVVPCSPVSGLFRMESLRRHLRTDIGSPTIKDFAEHTAGPDLLLQLLSANDYAKVGYVAEALALFREHDGTLTMAVSERLFDCYAQTRVWFGVEFGRPEYAAAALATVWLRKLKEGVWLWPRQIREEFLCDAQRVGTWGLLRQVPGVILTRLLHQA